MNSRNAWLDQVKGLTCLLIVCHHLAFYGPMADVVAPAAGGLMEWLYEYARMVVQVFLVIGGYWAAAGLAPQGQSRHEQVLPLLGKRFTRLVIPFAAALAVTLVANELARDIGFDNAAVSPAPTWDQLLAHLFLLHGVGGWESLSAGVWYVAIDFQLYALAALWIWLSRRLMRGAGRLGLTLAQLGVVALTVGSLWFWNLDSDLDNWAIYFFGAYGLGMLSWWASHSQRPAARWGWMALMLALLGVAWMIEWRTRIALAGVTGLLLASAGALRWPQSWVQWRWAPLQQLGQMSYSVFLIHFGICLLVNAIWARFWPTSIPMNALGLVLAVALSVLAGHGLYRWVERHGADIDRLVRWQLGSLGIGGMAAMGLF